MSSSVILACVAVAVSLFSFGINWRAAATAERRTRAPVLVTQRYWEEGVVVPGKYREGLTVENVGKGPALNIILMQQQSAVRRDEGPEQLKSVTGWINPIHLTPVAAGQTLECPIGPTRDIVGVCYTDILGNWYTTTAGPIGTLFREGRHLPPKRFGVDSVPFVHEVLAEGLSPRDGSW